MLSRLGFLALRDGSLELAGKNKPELTELKNLLLNLESEFDIKGFEKHDFFAPFPFLEGIVSADTMK